jgi:hypothetical protein
MLIKETLHKSDAKRIGLSVWKDARGNLVMHLQEFDIEGDCETFILCQSWNTTVAREKCARATQAAAQRFYNANIALARQAVTDRVAVLEGPKS